MEAEEVVALADEVFLDGRVVRQDGAETALQRVGAEVSAWHAEQFGQRGLGQPMKDAEFAAWLDEATDGDHGGDEWHRHASAPASEKTFEQLIQPQELPGTPGHEDIGEAAWIAPGDGSGIDGDTGDRSAWGWRRVADLLHQDRQPRRIGQAFGDAEPIGRAEVIEPTEIADGALPHPAIGRTGGLGEGVIGVALPFAFLDDPAQEHEGNLPERA